MTAHALLFFAGASLGALAIIGLHRRLGKLRTCALLAVWLLAADSYAEGVVEIVEDTLEIAGESRTWSGHEAAWPYLPLVTQFLVAFVFIFACWRDRGGRHA